MPRLSLLLPALLAATLARAEIRLASPFTDHMVLQCDQPVPVWGNAEPGEQITVDFADQKQVATAGADGKWMLRLTELKPSAEPRPFTVVGKNTVTLQDVLVGEVWLASGQSNMDFTVAKTPKYYFCGVLDEEQEVAAANHPLVRMFTGGWTRSITPKSEVAGTWKICTSENVREFSAVAYFFARDLQKDLKIPVGIVTMTYGASTAQAWVRREAIEADPQLKPVLQEFDEKVKAYVPLAGEELARWEEAAAKAKAAGKREPKNPRPDPSQDQHNPTVMFNGMIAPIVPFAIRGVLWYQGESITGPKELFPRWNETLITDWRQLWGRELPFYFCQLAALQGSSGLPQTREWQTEALKLPGTGMAVSIDIGDPKNVHPKNKAPLGHRLTLLALANVYGRQIEFSGPRYESSTIEGDAVRLKFSHLGGGLVAQDGSPKTFEIAGPDGKYVPAEATIDGETIVVRSPEIPAPTAARYAWSAYPEGCNLTNAAALPAAPFRTGKK